MIELKDKTVEELRKMASKKKIEGRSKMNKAELVRALKKKISSKKMKGGINGLPNNVLKKIYTYKNCKDIIKYLSKLSRTALNKINWDNMPEIPIGVEDEEENLNIDCAICSFIEDDDNKKKCKIYYNKCRLFDIYNKYIYSNFIAENNFGEIIDLRGLDSILFATIPNTDNMNSVRDDQNYLIRLGAQINEIPNNSFENVGLTSITIPDSVTIIGASSFKGNELKSIIIPDSVTIIGASSFKENELYSIIIPDSVREIGSYAFSDNRLSNIEIPNSVTRIGGFAFEDNRLETVTIPRRFKSSLYKIFGERAYDIRFTFTD